eukprot:3683510-Prymnesium_polylepis.1
MSLSELLDGHLFPGAGAVVDAERVDSGWSCTRRAAGWPSSAQTWPPVGQLNGHRLDSVPEK